MDEGKRINPKRVMTKLTEYPILDEYLNPNTPLTSMNQSIVTNSTDINYYSPFEFMSESSSTLPVEESFNSLQKEEINKNAEERDLLIVTNNKALFIKKKEI